MDDEVTIDPTNREQPGLLDRLRGVFSGDQGEGDAPRAVDVTTPPLETHNQVPVNEPYPTTEMHATPNARNEGSTDLEQIPQMTQPDAPVAPMPRGPSLSGSRPRRSTKTEYLT